jgi:hypothetical protein
MQNPTLLQDISDNFELLLPPNRETLLLLVALQDKIKKGEIEEMFTQREFEEAIDEVSAFLKRGQGIQKEIISKKLSQYYYTTLKKGNEYRYQLTVFARELVESICNEIEPRFEDTALIHTFNRTLKMSDEDLASIFNFEHWFHYHYEPSKRIILSHTENLQRLVDSKTLALRQLMKTDLSNTKDLINKFIEIFQQIGIQIDGLTDAMNFKMDVIDNIKAAEQNFLDKKESWEVYSRIRQEVEKFFDNIDSRILSINDRIQISISRLKALYETLQYKQLYKLKLEKFLLFLLKNSTNGPENTIILPEAIKAKKIPYFREKYTRIPNLNFTNVVPRDVPELEEDQEYKKLLEAANMKLLNRQESITKWLENINSQVVKGNEILYDDWFQDIYKEEKNLEVPIEVCFGLLHKYGRSKDVDVTIEKSNANKNNDDLTLWKMKLTPSNS